MRHVNKIFKISLDNLVMHLHTIKSFTSISARTPYEKQRLQNLMAYGKDIDEELRNINTEETSKEESGPIDLFSESE